jgi:hypothetical protein
MPTPINAALAQGLGLLNTALGAPVLYWRGVPISCVPGSLTDLNSVVMGGFTDGLVARLIVTDAAWNAAAEQSQFLLMESGSFLLLENLSKIALIVGPATPIVGRTVTYLGRTLRIVSATQDSSDCFYRIDLAAPTR